jgi:hypothetical protein
MLEVEDSQITLDQLSHFWNEEDGLPIFMADRPDICDIVEGFGFQIYYLVGNNVEVKKENVKVVENNKQVVKSVDTTYRNLEVFKVVNNFVGRCVRKASITLPGLSDVASSAHYNMPLIPHVIVDKLDQFFRLVDAQHGTESIVMLTYDMDKEGPEGWGILVPDQENTAAHCNYDPHSIAEIKPDNVMIVGSVHSHPHMAAYASGTDHADQADFDGIHITYGWQKSVNNGATQYHIEMQMAGDAYTLKPEDVFEDYSVQKEPDKDVVEWSSKVKKELPLQSTGGFTLQSNTQHSPSHRNSKGNTAGTKFKPRWIEYLSKDKSFDALNLPQDFIIFQEIEGGPKINAQCQICGAYLDHYNVFDYICDLCDVPLFTKDTQREKIAEELRYYCSQYNLDITLPVYMLGVNDDKSIFIMQVNNFSSDSELPPSAEYYLCCGTLLTESYKCTCPTQILPKDLDSFALYLEDNDVDIYANEQGSSCRDCANFWEPTCPKLIDELFVYVLDAKSQPVHFRDSITSYNCNSYVLDENFITNDYYDDDTYVYQSDSYSRLPYYE